MKILTEGSEVPNPVFVIKVHCISPVFAKWNC